MDFKAPPKLIKAVPGKFCGSVGQSKRNCSLQWCHKWRDSVSNHQRLYCLLNRLFRRRSKKTSKLRVTGLCEGDLPVDTPHKGLVTRKLFLFDDVIVFTKPSQFLQVSGMTNCLNLKHFVESGLPRHFHPWLPCVYVLSLFSGRSNSKVQGGNMGPTWVLMVPDGPHVGPRNLAIREAIPFQHTAAWLYFPYSLIVNISRYIQCVVRSQICRKCMKNVNDIVTRKQ